MAENFPGFYKKINDEIIYAKNYIHTPEGSFSINEKDLPLPSGWKYFESEKDALEFFSNDKESPDLHLKRSKDELISYAANKRWEIETGGIELPGIGKIGTDDRSKLLILGASQTLSNDSVSPLIINGIIKGDLTGLQFKQLNSMIVNHVDTSFRILKEILLKIQNDEISTFSDIETYKWQ